MITDATLHYLYDPFCGWCFGAAPLVGAATAIEGLSVEAHGIGMLAGANRKTMSPEWRDFVRPHEQRITEYTQAQFGDAYVDETQQNPTMILDSGVSTAAMLAARQLSGKGIDMLRHLQTAYYVDGRHISERDVILQIAGELGFARDTFAEAFDQTLGAPLKAHLAESNTWLGLIGARGVPAFALQLGDTLHPMQASRYFGQPDRFKADLEAAIAEARDVKARIPANGQR